MSRELSVSLLTALLLTFTAWSWGGVVLWTQFVTAGLGLLALGVALLPSRPPGQSPHPAARVSLLAAILGLIAALGLGAHDLFRVLRSRDATLQLIPDAQLPSLRFAEWGLRGALVGLLVFLLVLILLGFARSPEPRRRLFRFLPFWIGLVLFAWIACQSWNTWGVVVQRDLFWRILPRDHITWLPSGIDAPFFSDDEPGGMNGWRQLLILIGPWALLCALIATHLSRRTYAWLAVVACVNGLGVAIVGNIYRANKWTSFLGVDDPDLNVSPFGPFIYQNHAGAYLYLVAGLTLALTFYLAKRRGDKVDRGGPHLVAALTFIFLILGSASTMSISALFVAAALLIMVAPLAYFFDRKLRDNLSPIPAIAIVGLTAVVAYAGLLSTDAKKWRRRLDQKQQSLASAGADDRAPLRRASWLIVETADTSRQLSGWGAGSYRWVSPGFFRTQPEFLNRKGELDARATHAHNDWLQAPIEWGLAGWAIVAGTIAFFVMRVRAQFARPRAPGIALLSAILLFGAHSFLDFLLFIPLLTLLAVLVGWILVLESAEDPSPR